MNDTICLDDDHDDEYEEDAIKSRIPSEAEKPESYGPEGIIDLTWSSDEEEEGSSFSSSSSVHAPGSTSRTSPPVPIAQPQSGSSPDCITLDSPIPSPKPHQERNRENQTEPSETPPAMAADAVSSTPPISGSSRS